jgi:hypothetical protein
MDSHASAMSEEATLELLMMEAAPNSAKSDSLALANSNAEKDENNGDTGDDPWDWEPANNNPRGLESPTRGLSRRFQSAMKLHGQSQSRSRGIHKAQSLNKVARSAEKKAANMDALVDKLGECWISQTLKLDETDSLADKLNDIGLGDTPAQVDNSLADFLSGVQLADPSTRDEIDEFLASFEDTSAQDVAKSGERVLALVKLQQKPRKSDADIAKEAEEKKERKLEIELRLRQIRAQLADIDETFQRYKGIHNRKMPKAGRQPLNDRMELLVEERRQLKAERDGLTPDQYRLRRTLQRLRVSQHVARQEREQQAREEERMKHWDVEAEEKTVEYTDDEARWRAQFEQ